MPEKPQEAVAVIILNEEQTSIVLVKRRDIPVWVLPGGGIDRGESPEEAALREALEETGFEVKIVRKIAEYLPVNRLTQRTHYFECRIASGEARSSRETKAVAFFDVRALPKLLPPFYKNWIDDALANKPELICKKIEDVNYFILVKLLLQHPILVGRYLLTKLGIHLNHSD
ncbi:MAG: NUDIX hydrolase [Chlamydiales bacterium]|nr:NUDIX hydrolase [Chlamydiales bacterium]